MSGVVRPREAQLTARVLDFESAVAARRPSRRFNELAVTDGLVCVQLPPRMTPDQAEHYERARAFEEMGGGEA